MYAEGLLIDMSNFYIHHGLPCPTFFLHSMGFNTTYSNLYDHPPSHSLTAICGLHCCPVVPSVKEMLGRLCKPINSCERCRMSLDNVILCSYCMYVYQKKNNTKFSCIINLNIIYLLKNSLIGRGNLSKRGGEGL
jgi:hypothetical protein